jgi:hypothetical protein
MLSSRVSGLQEATMRLKGGRSSLVVGAGVAVIALGGVVAAGQDWGSKQQSDTRSHARQLFGVRDSLERSSSDDVDAAEALADPSQ